MVVCVEDFTVTCETDTIDVDRTFSL